MPAVFRKRFKTSLRRGRPLCLPFFRMQRARATTGGCPYNGCKKRRVLIDCQQTSLTMDDNCSGYPCRSAIYCALYAACTRAGAMKAEGFGEAKAPVSAQPIAPLRGVYFLRRCEVLKCFLDCAD